ncbi:MAG: hypothetical protein M1818_001895 [Claussenomyces sp. TS43310]|nr:MAG: hypothetical protein M1818_001895 [Claussenomyces sp. TS43310]
MDKDKWIERERQRWAKAFNIPCKEEPPPNFPPNTLYIMRALAALTIAESNQQSLCKALDKFYEEFWVNHTETHKPEVMQRLLVQAVGEEKAKKGKSLGFIRVPLDLQDENALELASNEGKALILKNTDQALADGAFGLPWFVCTNTAGQTEGFWGFDHLGQVAKFLGIDSLKQSDRWRAVL